MSIKSVRGVCIFPKSYLFPRTGGVYKFLLSSYENYKYTNDGKEIFNNTMKVFFTLDQILLFNKTISNISNIKTTDIFFTIINFLENINYSKEKILRGSLL